MPDGRKNKYCTDLSGMDDGGKQKVFPVASLASPSHAYLGWFPSVWHAFAESREEEKSGSSTLQCLSSLAFPAVESEKAGMGNARTHT